MQKVGFLVLLSIAAIASAIDVNRFKSVAEITDNDLEVMYRSYLNMAPFFVSHSDERFQYFKTQIINIVSHNTNSSKTWNREVNTYTGMMKDELIGSVIMDSQSCAAAEGYKAHSDFDEKDYPESFDWRNQGVVSPVKNQGNFASCWAFAATGAVESHWAIFTNSTPTLLSEQQLIDCVADADEEGGIPAAAFEYITRAGGIETENTYPYIMDRIECVFNQSVSGASVPAGAMNITTGDELAIMAALVQYGPIAAVIDISDDFLSYTGGIYISQVCGQGEQDNHAVLLVGYGVDQATGIKYWIGKNSWGRSWGEEGYFRIQRGVNMCGIADCASFPNMHDPHRDIVV